MPRKILLLILLPLLMLACKTLLPGTAPLPETPVSPTPRPTVAVSLPATRGKGTTFICLEPADGKLADLLAAEAKKAAALGQIPVVEFDANW